MPGSGHILGALETRAERVDLSGRLIVGGSPLMPMSVHIASGERRDATAASATGAKPDANTCHIRSATCRRPRCRTISVIVDWAAGQFRPVPRVSLKGWPAGYSRHMDWSLFGCARKGHVTYAPSEPELRERLVVPTAAGPAWRCLRCGAYAIEGQHGSGPAAEAPLVRRGKELRSELLLPARVRRVPRRLCTGVGRVREALPAPPCGTRRLLPSLRHSVRPRSRLLNRNDLELGCEPSGIPGVTHCHKRILAAHDSRVCRRVRSGLRRSRSAADE